MVDIFIIAVGTLLFFLVCLYCFYRFLVWKSPFVENASFKEFLKVVYKTFFKGA